MNLPIIESNQLRRITKTVRLKPDRQASLIPQLIYQDKLKLNLQPFFDKNFDLFKIYTQLKLTIPNLAKANYCYQFEDYLTIVSKENQQPAYKVKLKFSFLKFNQYIVVLLPVNKQQVEPSWIDYLECLVVEQKYAQRLPVKLALINQEVSLFDFGEKQKVTLLAKLPQDLSQPKPAEVRIDQNQEAKLNQIKAMVDSAPEITI